MQMVKIQIPDRAERARASIELSRHGRVDCYRDQVYVVPEPALKVLAELGVTHQATRARRA